MPAVRTWAALGQILTIPGVIPTRDGCYAVSILVYLQKRFTLSRTVDIESSPMREVSAEDHNR